MEQIDVFDELLNPLTPACTDIDTVHKQGLWHQTFACWLINPEKKEVFLQLRGAKNRVGANTFDASASGHLSSGELPENGFRELEEELGGNLSIFDKTYLGIYRNIAHLPNYLNREFCHVYFAKTTAALNQFALQAGEVNGIFSIKIDDGLALFSNARAKAEVFGKVWDGNAYQAQTQSVSTADFCCARERVQISGYYLKVFMMAERYINNHSPYHI